MRYERRIWFTSDLHFGHRAIIRYSRRPWPDADAMADGLVERWNARVALADHVYVLGDFALLPRKRIGAVLERLNGTKYLVRGNHDHNAKGLFEWEKDLHTLKVEDDRVEGGYQRIVLCHYPLLVWDRRHYGAWHLHGHSHGNLPDDPGALRLDVGVDVHGWAPLSYADVREIMETRPCWPCSKPVDHHGRPREE